jgi:hypothetical protein
MLCFGSEWDNERMMEEENCENGDENRVSIGLAKD